MKDIVALCKAQPGKVTFGSAGPGTTLHLAGAMLAQMAGRRVHLRSELKAAIQEMLDHDGPYVLDVIVPYTEHVLPMIPAGRSVKEMLLK